MINIRKLSPKDFDQVFEISRASFKEPWPKNEFEKYLEGSFVAEQEGKIAGFAVGKISDGKAVLKLIAASPEFRGEGVGKNLIEHIFKYFSENGAKEVSAHSRIHNTAGCNFLKSFGFEIIKTVKNYYRNDEAMYKTVPGEDAYLMIKKLDG